ncbi:MAG: hemolysin III family protein [Bacteroidales bacterium]|nr:hemolysin III family protein [Bacteroidales bacterium]MBN2818084.1 hemolysin III family protein [Bacteroidales bacterium]
MKSDTRFTYGEELANTISHGVATAFAITGLVLLVVFSAKYGTGRHVLSFTIFGATLTILYLSSTINHALKHGKTKDLFHNIDQIAIFLLIAGTYTPLALVALKGDWGWTLFGLEWGLAISGIVVKLFIPNKYENGVNIFYILSYILMGWMLLFFLFPIFRNIPIMGIVFIFIGGICYTLGTIFYKLKRIPYTHLVWHLLVIAGSVCHWVAIMVYVLPLNTIS